MPEKKVNVVKKMMKMIVGFLTTNFWILTGAEKYSRNLQHLSLNLCILRDFQLTVKLIYVE
jgi:hypothetical protein